jgi:hypothetical protein
VLNFSDIPVTVICKDRTRYLDTTLKSISATVPSSCPLAIFNDGTENRTMLQYLETSNRIRLDEHPYPNHHPDWNRYVGFIHNDGEVEGIGGKIETIIQPRPMGRMNLGLAAKHAFTSCECEYVIRIEDDVILKAGWFKAFATVLADQKPGILSGFRHFFGPPPVLTNLDERAQHLLEGYTGGCLMAISRKLYDQHPELFLHDNPVMNDQEDDLFDGCRRAGLPVHVLRDGYCQHIGIVSQVYSHKQFFINDRINLRRIDPEFRPPAALSTSVASFPRIRSIRLF